MIGSRIYLHIFWYHICRNRLIIVEIMPTWMSTPPDLKVAVKSIDIFNVLLFISAWLMSCFVLVLRNTKKEKLILIVLFNQRQIREQIISRFTLPTQRLSPFKSNQINQVLKKQYFGHNMPVCVPTVHWWLLHKG